MRVFPVLYQDMIVVDDLLPVPSDPPVSVSRRLSITRYEKRNRNIRPHISEADFDPHIEQKVEHNLSY